MLQNRKNVVAIQSASAAWVAAVLSPVIASAQLNIGLGSTVIAPTANQTVNLVASTSGGPVGIDGIDIYVQIDNGGVSNGYATNPIAPTITGIDTTKGIFNASNSTSPAPEYEPNGLIAYGGATVTTTDPVISTSAVLGTVTFNAAGLAPGSTFDVYFEQVGNGPNGGSDFGLSDSDYRPSGGAVTPFLGATYSTSPFVVTIGPNITQWNTSGGGTWTAAGDWSNGLPDGAGGTAIFSTGVGSQITTATPITLDGNHTVGHMVFNNSNSYTINPGSPSGQITIDNSFVGATGTPDIQVLAGSHTINAPIVMAAGLTVNSSSGAAITLGGAVGGSGGLSLIGNGSLTLGAANNYSGGTTIASGTLAVTNSGALSSGGVAINGSGTLDIGSGSPLNLNLGSAAFSMASTSTLKLQVNSSSSFSSLQTSGSATLGGTLNLNVSGSPTADGTKFTVLNTGTRSGVFSGYTTNLTGAAFDTSKVERTGQLSIVPYFNGFENVNGTWANNASTFGNSVVSYILGANPVTPGNAVQVVNPAAASANSAYGKLTPTPETLTQGYPFPAVGNVGPLTRFGGNRTSFGTGFTTQADVYIDPSWTGDANGTGFDYSSAVSDTSGNFLRDFILHVFKANGTLYACGDCNSSYNEDTRYFSYANKVAITSAGWYTIQDSFHNDGTGNLAVDIKLFNNSGGQLFQQTQDVGDNLSGVGGNNYGWFVNIDTGTGSNDYLNVDNVKLLTNTGAGLASPAALTSGTQLLTDSPALTKTNSTFIINGTNPGAVVDGYDYLNTIYGTTLLSGDLSVTVTPAFESQITQSDAFTIIQAPAIDGTYANIGADGRVETTDGSGSFAAAYESTSSGGVALVLTDFQAVPEPGSLSLLALGGLGLLGRRRR